MNLAEERRGRAAGDGFGQTGQLFQRLKEGTEDIHRKTEERVPVFRAGFGREDYARLLEGFHGFWTPLENRLAEASFLKQVELGLESRLKSSLLREDLRILGRNPDTLPLCTRLPAVDTFPRAIGCLYVLEGSTLGARLISRRIESELRLRRGAGASFFNAYGELAGQRWKEFRSFAEAHADGGQTEEIVAAARETFQCFYEWLGESS